METDRQDQIMKDFGKNLEKIRNEKNLSLRELAHLADVDHSSIFRIESGLANPMLTMIIALAEAMDVSPKDLLP